MNYGNKWGYKRKDYNKVKKSIILVICVIVMMLGIGLLFWNNNGGKDSFYQKLVNGYDVNILVVGDSIGEGAGTRTDGKHWFLQLQSYLKATYSENILLTNVSMGGNTSYAGYVRTMVLDDDIDYDLAIICYGQNDGISGFSTNYESIIRAVMKKYQDCSIISILESSQREYTEKMLAIKSICEHYEIPIADTIAAFNNSGRTYEELTVDDVHPNDAGQDIYFNTVKNIIDENVNASTGKMKKVDAINPDVNRFDNFKWFGVNEAGFKRESDTTFILNTSASGIMGMDYVFLSGDNKADIYVDGELYESPSVTFDYSFSQRHIIVVNENCVVNNEIKIIFSTKEQADDFKGMCFSWK